jgi:uncharacterized membrane protein YeaQ/YmgE (transglycosylase-associated protein family)
VGVFLWIAFGVVTGAFAKSILPGPHAGGAPVGILVGVSAGLIGGALGSISLGAFSATLEAGSLLVAVSATMFALLGYRAYALRLPSVAVVPSVTRNEPRARGVISPAAI